MSQQYDMLIQIVHLYLKAGAFQRARTHTHTIYSNSADYIANMWYVKRTARNNGFDSSSSSNYTRACAALCTRTPSQRSILNGEILPHITFLFHGINNTDKNERGRKSENIHLYIYARKRALTHTRTHTKNQKCY